MAPEHEAPGGCGFSQMFAMHRLVVQCVLVWHVPPAMCLLLQNEKMHACELHCRSSVQAWPLGRGASQTPAKHDFD